MLFNDVFSRLFAKFITDSITLPVLLQCRRKLWFENFKPNSYRGVLTNYPGCDIMMVDENDENDDNGYDGY